VRLADVNVLIAAHRPDHPHHAVARSALVAMAEVPYAVSVLALAGFVRIVTNRRAFEPPTPLAQALQFVREVSKHPNARIVTPGSAHLDWLDRACRAAEATVPLVADAQHAAVALEHGCTLVTFDADFRRFEALALRWELLA
jgi:toxin-antitoxin system PIN domain toxin